MRGEYGEPWESLGYIVECEVDRPGRGKRVCGCRNEEFTETQMVANASRIVTCVNELAGVQDPAGLMEVVREIGKLHAEMRESSLQTNKNIWEPRMRLLLDRLAAHLEEKK